MEGIFLINSAELSMKLQFSYNKQYLDSDQKMLFFSLWPLTFSDCYAEY